VKKWIAAILGTWLSLAPTIARADTRSICVYDPAGRAGDYFALMSKYATNASTWGVEVEVRPYTDEETATKDYEAGVCDGVVATGVRLQRFNRFASTIEAIGGIQDYPTMKQMVTTLSTSAGAAAKLSENGNAVVGFIPVGAVYLFVRDRSVDSVAKLAGKRIATLSTTRRAPRWSTGSAPSRCPRISAPSDPSSTTATSTRATCRPRRTSRSS